MTLATLTGYKAAPTFNYNVKAYGAKGDGTTDDRAAIQAAIDAANAAYVATGAEQTVYFPGGRYYLPMATAPALNFPDAGYGRRIALAIRPGVNLLGFRDAILTAAQADLESFIAPLPSGQPFTNGALMGGDRWSIRGLVFDPQATAGAEYNGGGVSAGASNDWAITDCVCRNLRGDFVTLIGSSTASPSRWRFERNETVNTGGQSILAEIPAQPMTDVLVADHYHHDPMTFGEAFAFNGAAPVVTKRMTYRGNRVVREGTCVFAKSQDLIIADNYMSLPPASGGSAYMIGGDHITFTGNIVDCSESPEPGANHPLSAFTNTTNVVVSGNTFRMGNAGIKVTGGQRWVFSDNLVITSTVSGDAATGTAVNLAGVSSCEVIGNRITGAGDFNSISVGADSVVEGNHLGASGNIGVGARSRVTGNRVTSAPLNGAGPQTFAAITAGDDCIVTHNQVSGGTSGGAITMGTRCIVQANKIENTWAGGYYTFSLAGSNYVLDNMPLATATPGTFGGNPDGFVLGGTGNVKRVL